VAVAAAAAVAAVAGGAALADRVAGAGLPAAPAPRLAGYDIAYRVTTELGAVQTSRRRVLVRRPFWSSDVTTSSAGARTLAQIVRPGHAVIDRDGALTDLGPQSPRLAPADVAVDLVLPSLVKQGMAVARGNRVVAGRQCRTYRMGGPVGDPFAAPTASEFADICVDQAGLVLFEDWTTSGKHTRTTEAVSVVAAAPPEGAFSPAGVAALDADVRLQEVRPLALTGKPGEVADYWRVVDRPWGLRLAERASVVPADGPPRVVDVYRAGTAAVVVEHTVGSSEVTSSGAVRSVRVKGLGGGRAFLTWHGPEIVLPAEDGLVVLRGTLDLDHLAAFAARLRRQ
jgi:hypothetical protein